MLFAILINVKRMYPSIPITMKWIADHQPKNQRLNKELYDIFNRFPKAISEALTDIFVHHRLN